MTCQELKSAVVEWMGTEVGCVRIEPKSSLRPSTAERFLLKLPILKPNGDSIDLGVEIFEDERCKISDLGDTRAGLFLAGVDETVAGGEFTQIKKQYKIGENNEELFVERLDTADLVNAIFEFAHAVQSMMALQLTVAPREPRRDFPAMVAKFFVDLNVSFEIPPDSVEGRTGRWKFHFALNHARQETLVRAISAPGKTEAKKLAELAAYEIGDIRASRQLPTSFAIVADDERTREAHWQPEVVRLFELNEIPFYAFLRDRDLLTKLAYQHQHPRA